MKIGVSGKGGTGKTTLSAVLARTYARRGRRVLTIDADSNPNLSTSLGIDAGVAAAVRSMPSRAFDHEATVTQLLSEHAVTGPDGVRMVLAARIERAGSG